MILIMGSQLERPFSAEPKAARTTMDRQSVVLRGIRAQRDVTEERQLPAHSEMSQKTIRQLPAHIEMS